MKKELEARKLQNQLLKWYLKNFEKLTSIKTVDKKVKLTQSTQKKKTAMIKRIIIPLNLLSLLLIFSCGSDDIMNVTNPPTSNDSAIYSLDSFAIRSNTIGVTNNIIAGNVLTDFDSLKITFDCSTNLTNDSTTIGLYLNDSVTNFFNVPKPHTVNHTVYWKQHHISQLSFSLYLRLYNSDNLPKYLKVSNFKVYKIL